MEPDPRPQSSGHQTHERLFRSVELPDVINHRKDKRAFRPVQG
jgi:hypothetical protein